MEGMAARVVAAVPAQRTLAELRGAVAVLMQRITRGPPAAAPKTQTAVTEALAGAVARDPGMAEMAALAAAAASTALETAASVVAAPGPPSGIPPGSSATAVGGIRGGSGATVSAP